MLAGSGAAQPHPDPSHSQPSLPPEQAGSRGEQAAWGQLPSAGCMCFTEHCGSVLSFLSFTGNRWGSPCVVIPSLQLRKQRLRHGVTLPSAWHGESPPSAGWGQRARPRVPVSESQRGRDHRPWPSLPLFPDSGTQSRAYGNPTVRPPPWVVMRVPAQALPGQICFDSKPRIISKGTKDSPSVCSNLAAKHSFYNNK